MIILAFLLIFLTGVVSATGIDESLNFNDNHSIDIVKNDSQHSKSSIEIAKIHSKISFVGFKYFQNKIYSKYTKLYLIKYTNGKTNLYTKNFQKQIASYKSYKMPTLSDNRKLTSKINNSEFAYGKIGSTYGVKTLPHSKIFKVFALNNKVKHYSGTLEYYFLQKPKYFSVFAYK
jgi:hypothetical protein